MTHDTYKIYNDTSIQHTYDPHLVSIDFLKTNLRAVQLYESVFFVCANAYHQNGLGGTHPSIFLRQALFLKLEEAARELPTHLSFYVFDAFRSLETQLELFNIIKEDVRKIQPHLSEDALVIETKKYAAHPHDKSRFPFPPHNTGGAIDIGLCDRTTKKLIEFGTPFDDPTEKSSTDFFEADFNPAYGFSKDQWLEARTNRRLLFNLMKNAGFTNYSAEWWHYDLGNWVWAKHLQCSAVFESMEADVLRLR